MGTAVVAAMLVFGQTADAAAPKWPQEAFFGLHYDLHPGAADTELGRETTYEHIRAELEKVRPDYVQYDCKGHPGYTGYPTEVGSASPGIVNDALMVWRQVTRDMGVPLSIHYSGVFDQRAIELHPEWANIGPDGKPNTNYTDPLSAYRQELMIPQLLEVVEKYDIDGVWIDGENWASLPCYSDRCKEEFTRRTGIADAPTKPGEANWAEWLAFQRGLFVEHVTEYADALHAKKPSIAVCSNWMYSVRQPEPIAAPVDYLSGDFDPSFGAERACAEARFLDARGLPWNLMAWTFLNTGGQGWTMKAVPHLCQEVSVVLAQGGGVFLYNQPQRSGRLTSWHQDLFAQVAEFCRERKEFCFRTQTIPQVAILHSQSFYYRHNQPLFNFASANHPMEGALHAVLENGCSADILNEEMLLERMASYPVVIVPEQEGLPENVRQALTQYVQNGGRLLISGAHVANEFGELAGVAPEADKTFGSGWLPADNGCVTVTGPWQGVTLAGAQELAPFLVQQDPELNRSGSAAATLHKIGEGLVVAVHGPLFRDYHASHYPRLRRFIGDALAALDAPGLVRLEGPWFIEMSARQKDGRRLIQFVNRGANGHLAPNRHTVEHVPDAGPFTVRVPVEVKPSRCYLAPDEEGLEWSWRDGILTANIAGLNIHNTLVIE